jgi:hypothetical protein
MILAVATSTWLALSVGLIAVCRAAAHGDAQAGLSHNRRDATAEACGPLRSHVAGGRGRFSLGVLARHGELRLRTHRLGRHRSAAG